MKKYYAKQLPAESFDYEVYFNEGAASDAKFCAFGNRNFANLNYDLIEDIVKYFRRGWILNSIDRELSESAGEVPTVNEENAAIVKVVKDYFHKDDHNEFTDEECYRMHKLAYDYLDCSACEENYIICRALEIIYGEPFKCGTIRGSSQGDWMEYICPEAVSDEAIKYIEAVLFATGTEYEVTVEKIESADEFDNAYSYPFYTCKRKDADVKQELAESIRCSPDELVLLNIKGSHTYTVYDYEEV